MAHFDVLIALSFRFVGIEEMSWKSSLKAAEELFCDVV
jgi:hypothetical protein